MAKITVQNTELTVLSHNDKDYINLTTITQHLTPKNRRTVLAD